MTEENGIVPLTLECKHYGFKKISVDLVRCDRAKQGRGKKLKKHFSHQGVGAREWRVEETRLGGGWLWNLQEHDSSGGSLFADARVRLEIVKLGVGSQPAHLELNSSIF